MPPADAHIVVVEDDPQYRSLVVRMLEAAGYRVTAAEGFTAALNAIEGAAAVDPLLADIGMPAGSPHGLSIGKVAQLRKPGLKVLYMSGSDPSGYLFARGESVLRKPFGSAELLTAIQAALAA
jgi:two-component system OmpR family response regulator